MTQIRVDRDSRLPFPAFGEVHAMGAPSEAMGAFWFETLNVLFRSNLWSELAAAVEEPVRLAIDRLILSDAARTSLARATSKFFSVGLQIPLIDK